MHFAFTRRYFGSGRYHHLSDGVRHIALIGPGDITAALGNCPATVYYPR